MRSFCTPIAYLSFILLMWVSIPGCGDRNGATETTEKANGAAETPKLAASKDSASLEGRWALVMTVPISRNAPRQDIYAAVIDIAAQKEGYSANVVAGRPAPQQQGAGQDSADAPELTDVRLEDGKVEFSIDVLGSQNHFAGEVRDGIVFGNILRMEQMVDPARLVPFQADTLDEFMEPQNPPGLEELTAAFENPEPFDEVAKFTTDHPDSPMAMEAQQQLLFSAKQRGLTTEQIEDAVKYLRELAGRWGPRMEQMADIHAGFILAQTRFQPELAVKYFQRAEKNLTEDSPQGWKEIIATGRKRADAALAVTTLTSGNGEGSQQAEETLKAALEQDGFDHLILFSLAKFYEEQGRTEEAIEYYARLVALPHLDTLAEIEFANDDDGTLRIQEKLAQLWQKEHGSDEGLEDYIDDVYSDSIYGFVNREALPEVPEDKNRVVLCELFTGSRCPPCMAADVATGGIAQAFPQSAVIVLRYHQHTPAPDPLANADNEARMEYYLTDQQGQIRRDLNELQTGTPSTYINGQWIMGVAGPMLNRVEPSFNLLLQHIQPELSESTPLNLELAAVGGDGNLEIKASVTGLEAPSESLRLRLVLAENDVNFKAANGIRVHNMIARKMPGGTGGIAVTDGKLEYTGTVSLADFKQELIDHLAAIEENRAEVFPHKPLQLQNLQLVAFVQDDETKAILQSATVPVTGTLEYPADLDPKVSSVDAPQSSASITDAETPAPAPSLPAKPAPKGPKLTPPAVDPD